VHAATWLRFGRMLFLPLGIRPFAKNMFTRRAHLGPGSRGGCEHAFDDFTELRKSRGIEHGVPESTAVWRPESPWQLEQQCHRVRIRQRL